MTVVWGRCSLLADFSYHMAYNERVTSTVFHFIFIFISHTHLTRVNINILINILGKIGTSRYNCDAPHFCERITQTTTPETKTTTALKRDLNVFDLFMQTVAQLVGCGIFIITPLLMKTEAGPSLFLSYFFVGFIVGLTALSYMDLASRYTCISNSYVFVYATLGEYLAVLTASIIIGEMITLLSLTAKGVAVNFDEIFFNGTLQSTETTFYKQHMPLIPDTWVDAVDFDIIAVVFLLLISIINFLPVKWVAVINTVFCVYAVLIMIIYNTVCCIFGSWDTFSNSTDPVSKRTGIFPYGLEGVIASSAIVALTYSGFEATANLAEESKDPKKDIPIATGLGYTFVIFLYTWTAFSMAYFTPWWSLNNMTGVVGSLTEPRFKVLFYLVSAGVLVTCTSTAIATSLTVIRLIYGISVDGLSFKCLTSVSSATKVPYASVLVTFFVTIIVLVTFDYMTLCHMIAAGVLIVFTLINISLLAITYKKTDHASTGERSNLTLSHNNSGISSNTTSSDNTNTILYILLASYTAFCTGIAIVFKLHDHPYDTIAIVFFAVSSLILLYTIDNIFEATRADNYFVCPLKPYIQGAAILFNSFLAVYLKLTAIYFQVAVLILGSFVYFLYGFFNSEVTVSKQIIITDDESSL